MTPLKISVMITTRNRIDDLVRTCETLSRLSPSPYEVLITADGCTDGTVLYIQENFPSYRLTVNEVSTGSVASRAAMMQKASGNLVLALDDDSYPEQMDCLATLENLFRDNPNLAVATFPQRTDEYPESLAKSDFGEIRSVRFFPNSGACLRVSTYRSLPGFEPMFFHMYEEPDYAIQCISNGWQVTYFPEITIRHHFSGAGRNEIRNHGWHARNEFWSVIMRCPAPYCIALVAYRVFSHARYSLRRGPNWLMQEPVWWWQAIKGLPNALRKRQPLSWQGYRDWLAQPPYII